MKRILIVNPPALTPKPFAPSAELNAGVYVLASYLQQKNYDVDVFDFSIIASRMFDGWENVIVHRIAKCGNFQSERCSKRIYYFGRQEEEFKTFVNLFKPEEIYISCLMTYSWEGAKLVYDVIRKDFPTVKIKLGGNYVSLCYDHALQHFQDAELVITSIDDESRFTKINLGLYRQIPRMFPILSTIGCPFSCGWCAVPILEGHKMLFKSPLLVVDDIEDKINHGITRFKFLDSNITANYDSHFKIILQEIIKRNLKANFHIYGGINALFATQERLELMAQAGFCRIQLPIESIDETILYENNRTTTVQDWIDAVKRIGRIKNTEIASFLLCGMPGQTIKDIYKTINFLEDYGVAPCPLFFTPIPKTRYEDNTKPLEELNPFLFPYATNEMPVKKLEELLCHYVASGQTVSELIVGEETLYSSSPAIKIGDLA